MSGLVAIVGRPNVGKSALFNRIVGRRIAIVHDRPGVTRDRVSAEAELRGRPFTLVDTGGIGLLRREKAEDVIVRAAMAQVDLAIEAAQVVILVVNVQEGVVPLDREVADRLRLAGKPVLVAVNKADSPGAEGGLVDFAQLGFDRLFPVSAIHGRGVKQLTEAALALLPPPPVVGDPGDPDAVPPEPPLKLAIVGRPNVGKSSLVNALTRSERVIVSEIPGTTRDAVDVPFVVDTDGVRQAYTLIDTAGMRKTRRVDDTVEFFSVQRSEDSIQRADVVVFVLDASSGILEQDKKIADRIVEAGKGCILVVNKWDLFEEQVRAARVKTVGRRGPGHAASGPELMTTLGEFAEWVQEKLFFLDYAPVIFTSAKSGFHLERLLEAVRYVTAQLRQKVPTSLLNRTLQEAIERRQPVSSTGIRVKFFYATQVKSSPPTFVLFVNRDVGFSPPYNKYLIGELRKAFGFEGVPLVLVPRPRPKTVESKNRRNRNAPRSKSTPARPSSPSRPSKPPRR